MSDRDRALMVVGAHALDAELMGGPAVLKWSKAGRRAVIVHATRGERGHKVKPPEEYALQLETEMKAAAASMGAEFRWMGYRAGAIPELRAAAQDFARQVREIRPEVVITHWAGSFHPRHRQTQAMVREGVRLAAMQPGSDGQSPHVVSAVFFGENLEDLDGFRPTTYLDITDVFDEWYNALRSYELFRGGVQVFPYVDYYRTNSVVRGIEAGFALAKAFMLDAYRVVDLQGLSGTRPLDPTI